MNSTFPPTSTESHATNINNNNHHSSSIHTTVGFNHDRAGEGSIHGYHIPHSRHHDPEPRRPKLGSDNSNNNNNGSGPVRADLSIAQRMVAATSGSLLTSLLVTPLDVVRVRLQAQQPNSPQWISNNTSPSSFASSITSSFRGRAGSIPFQAFSLPSTAQLSRPLSELGVTTCCREVFWVPATNEVCVVGPAASSVESAAAAVESCLHEQASRKNFTGTWEGLVKIGRYEGVTSLYRGLSPTLLMAIPANVIYFTGYDALRFSPNSPMSGLSDNAAPLVAGSVARMAAASIISPLELFRTRLQATATPSAAHPSGESSITAFRETVDSVRRMVAMEGYKSLWRGLTLTLWRDVPFSGIYWLGYEKTKQAFIEQRSWRTHELGKMNVKKAMSEPASFTDAFLAGSLSGAVAAFITQPFDVGKTRRQVWQNSDGAASTAAATAAQEGSMPKILSGIYKAEGVRGLWKGCVPRLLKISPACAIMISSYEVAKSALATEN